jgi:hypothetical protein
MIKEFRIKEEDKTNEQELGKKLLISYGVQGSNSQPEVYSDIEEIEARFIEPMNDFVREVTGNPLTGENMHSK